MISKTQFQINVGIVPSRNLIKPKKDNLQPNPSSKSLYLSRKFGKVQI